MDETTRARFAAQHRRRLVTDAEAGDADAGRAMLTHAMVALHRATPADEADAVALEWARQALRLATVEGLPIARAFGVERTKGRPRRPVLLDVIDAALVASEVQALAAKFRTEGRTAAQREAERKVARRLNIGWSTLRKRLALIEAPASRRGRGRVPD